MCPQVELVRRDYVANGGWETFLSYEDPEQDILIGLLRLRRCSPQSFRPELKGGASIVRELHVYGSVVPVSSRDPSKFQHQVGGRVRQPPPLSFGEAVKSFKSPVLLSYLVCRASG